MEEHIVKILSIEPLTHDVNRYRIEKPEGYKFIPGQATEVAINEGKWKKEARPFTFTCLNDDTYLEFSIKSYTDHDGVTNKLRTLKAGDELIIHDVWGAIQYKGSGTFIAGGAGVTPFIAIFRQLKKDGKVDDNQLLFSNKTEGDIILKDEFQNILGAQFINTLTDEENANYHHGFIDQDFLKDKVSDFSQNFYICGPDPMIKAMKEHLKALGAEDSVITIEV